MYTYVRTFKVGHVHSPLHTLVAVGHTVQLSHTQGTSSTKNIQTKTTPPKCENKKQTNKGNTQAHNKIRKDETNTQNAYKHQQHQTQQSIKATHKQHTTTPQSYIMCGATPKDQLHVLSVQTIAESIII